MGFRVQGFGFSPHSGSRGFDGFGGVRVYLLWVLGYTYFSGV